MSEVARELTIQISANGASTAQKDIKGLQNAVDQAEAKFKTAGAGIKGFEQSTAGMQARVTMLSDKLKAQQGIVDKAAGALEKAKAKMVTAADGQKKLAADVEKARAAYNAQVTATGKNSEAAKALADELKKLEGQYEAQSKSAQTAAQAVQRTETQLIQARAAVKGTESELKAANATLQKHGSVWGQARQKVEEYAKAAEKAGKKWTSVGGTLNRTVTLPIVAVGGAAIKAAIDWESAFTGVQKTVDGTARQMQALHDGILAMSETIPSSAGEIAKVAEAAGQLGIETDNVLGFSGAMIDLGNSTNLSAEDAATSLAKFANVMQMNQGNFQRLGSVIVDLGNNYATTERDIVEMGQRLSAAGKQTGMTEANVMALATALSSVGVESEAGGSAFSKVMLDIDMAAAKGGKEIKQYAQVAGMSAKDFVSAWNVDPAKALNSFVVGLGNVEKNGGNAALVLEAMGLKEVRLRNALLSTASAGNILSSAIDTANNAWAKNSALTEEAGKRYGTTASRITMLKNQTVNLGAQFGRVMVPTLEKLADGASSFVGGLSKMNPVILENIVKFGLFAAATGPVVTGMGKIITASGTIAKFITGPAGWVTLAIGAVAGLGVAIANIKSPIQQVQDRLKNIKISVDEKSVEAISGAINTGIEAANKVHALQVTIDADTDALVTKMTAAFSDEKFKPKEYKDLTKAITDTVAPDVTAAKAALDGMTGDVKEKTAGLITELEGTYKDANALLAQIYKDKRTPTEAEIAQLVEYLRQIGVIRGELQAANVEAIAFAKESFNLTAAGYGNNETTGTAIGYVTQTRNNARADAFQKYQDDLIKYAGNLAEQNKAGAEYQKTLDGINASAAAAFQQLADGIAKAAGAETILASINQDSEALTKTLNALNQASGAVSMDKIEVYRKAFAPDGALYKYLSPQDKIDIASYIDWSNLGIDPETAATSLENFALNLGKQLNDAIAQNATNPQINPVLTFAQSLFDNGSLEGVDLSTFTGAMEGAIDTLKIPNMFEGTGADASSSLAAGITANTPTVVTSVRNQFQAAIDEANRMRPKLAAAMSYLQNGGAGGGSGGVNNSRTITYSPTASMHIGTYVANNPYDAEILLANQQRMLKDQQTARGKFPGRVG